MAAALVPLQNITLSSSQTSIGFANLPTTGFRDLRLVIFGVASSAADDVSIYLNNDTGYNYSRVYMFGNGSSTGSISDTGVNQNVFKITYYGSISPSERSTITVDFLDAFATDKHKTYIARANRAGSGVDANASRWASTSAITAVMVKAATNSFAAGSTFALYGVVS